MAVQTTCLFDLDGTLANTLPDLAAATNEALRIKGFPACPYDTFPHMVGDGVRKLIERALGASATPENTERVLASFLPIYDALCLQQTVVYPGVAALVDRLQQAGIHLLVVTNKPQAQAEKIVRHFFGDAFEGIYGGGEAYPRKPDPTAVHLAMEQVGAVAGHTWFVGDSDVDVFTAHAGGIPCIGVAWGFRGEEELYQAGADHIAYSAEDIEQLVF